MITAKYLSSRMLGRESYNLNLISFDSAIGLVTLAIEAGVNVRELYVDTVGDADRYTERLTQAFPGVKCVAAAKADSLYPVVSAASIVAKACPLVGPSFSTASLTQVTCLQVARDAAIKQWAFEEHLPSISREFGCGYPGGALKVHSRRCCGSGAPSSSRPNPLQMRSPSAG